MLLFLWLEYCCCFRIFRDPFDISDSDSDLDEEEDQKFRKKKKKKKVSISDDESRVCEMVGVGLAQWWKCC